METRLPGIKENPQNVSLLRKEGRLPMKLPNIPRQQNITPSTIAYTRSVMTHIKTRKLE